MNLHSPSILYIARYVLANTIVYAVMIELDHLV